MKLYSAIDLHSNNQYVVVSDENDKRVLDKRIPNRLEDTLALFEPHRDSLVGVAVEPTYNWYWLVDGLIEHGYSLHLVNTAAVKRYSGLKYSDDKHDAAWLAHLMRLSILPTGYINPKEQRHIRDLLRKRVISVQTYQQKRSIVTLLDACSATNDSSSVCQLHPTALNYYRQRLSGLSKRCCNISRQQMTLKT